MASLTDFITGGAKTVAARVGIGNASPMVMEARTAFCAECPIAGLSRVPLVGVLLRCRQCECIVGHLSPSELPTLEAIPDTGERRWALRQAVRPEGKVLVKTEHCYLGKW